MFAPGAVLLWLGIASTVVGTILYFIPDLSWEHQLLIFSILSVLSIVAWRTYIKRNPTKTDLPTLNRRGEQYIDRVFTMDAPIVNGFGKIKVDDSIWKVRGDDCEEGTRIKIISVVGTEFNVEVIPQNNQT